MAPGNHLLIIAALLFATGITLVITKRNAIMVLLGIELMFNASNLNLIAFDSIFRNFDAHLFILFVIVVAVCEVAVGLAIVIRVYQYYHTSIPDDVNTLKD